MTWVVIAAALVVVAGVAMWVVSARQHPEQAATHGDTSRQHTLDHGHDAVARRPAGPDAENMSSERPGGFVPPGEPVPIEHGDEVGSEE